MYPSVYVLLFVSLLGFCSCKNCVTEDKCKCTFDDGSGTVDIWSTSRVDGYPQFYDESSTDGYLYSYNPCKGFLEGSCYDTSVCQFDVQFYGYYDLGTEDSASFSYDGSNVVAEYTSADGTRKTYVTLVCDPSATTPSLVVLGETEYLVYRMTMTSAAACPVGGSSSSAISGGSVLLIVFFVLIAVYLIAGVAFNKFRKGESGKELLPNRQFWLDIPALIKDGFAFVAGLVCRRKGYGAM